MAKPTKPGKPGGKPKPEFGGTRRWGGLLVALATACIVFEPVIALAFGGGTGR
jgi:hypothetical protein